MIQLRKTTWREIIYLPIFIYLENVGTLSLKTPHPDPSPPSKFYFGKDANVQKTRIGGARVQIKVLKP